MTVLEMLYARGFYTYLHGFGAIDFWLTGKYTSNSIFISTNASTIDLAKLFENLRYPGVDLADAAVTDENEKTYFFKCIDSIDDNKPSFILLDFYQDCKTKKFHDPHGIYPILKEIRDNLIKQKTDDNQYDFFQILKNGINPNIDSYRVLTDTALFISKYFNYDCGTDIQINKIAALFNLKECSPPCQEEQRLFLTELITSLNPGHGLELLKESGFIKSLWAELAILEEADQSKDFHPEGNAWEHTLETFRHRKTGSSKARGQRITNNTAGSVYDLRLSLGLLLHDTGKPIASSTSNHRYEGHAQLGEIQARRFLDRLGFDQSLINDICFLVLNHMLPAALPRLPLYRTEQILSSPLFPLLLELYRCDESSSFKGLDGYYESSAAYQQFLRNRRVTPTDQRTEES
ncbi:MAG: HD domain-containing protein [Treponema sp.]|nr:HD domain-containing protein [Treponema sp.]